MLTYPIVKIPASFTAALESVPTPPAKPEPAPLPCQPVRPDLTLGRVGWAILLVTLGFWQLSQHLELGAGAVAMGGIAVWIWAEHYAERRYKCKIEAYRKASDRHLAYPAALEHYEKGLADHIHPNTIMRHRDHRMAAVLATIKLLHRPIPPSKKRPRQGRSESAFLCHLREHFGADTIFTNHQVRNDNPRVGKDWYYPDVVYSDNSGLCIDVEIDEPYVWNTGEPHHCEGQDDVRNAFFLSRQWPVVRFTEEQVMLQPLLCCQVLAALIFHLTRRHYAARFYCERLTPYPQWDWFEARRLAGRQVREESYKSVV